MLTYYPTYTPATIKEPPIIKITPRFLSGKTLEQVVLEAREVVILRAIDRMPHGEFGIDNARLHIKFKALLVLLAHELFYALQKWRMQESAYLRDFIKRRHHEFSQKPADFKASIKQYFEARIDLYPNAFSFDEKLFDDAVLFSPELADILAQTEFPPLELELSLFDHSMLRSIVKMENHKSTVAICKKYHLESEENKIEELRMQYSLAVSGFSTFLFDNFAHLKIVFNDITLKTVAQVYKKIFLAFKQTKSVYFNNFLLELYFQQSRKPELASSISLALNQTYIPHVNLFYQRNKWNEKVTFDTVNTWAASFTAQPLPPSIQEIISANSQNLHTTTNSLVSSPSILQHIFVNDIPDEKVQPPKEVPVPPELITIEAKTELFAHYPKNNVGKPLFKKPIPGSITQVDVIALNVKCAHLKTYRELFADLSTKPGCEKEDKDRQTARRFFATELEKADKVEKIAALVQVANPYINRHMHVRIDRGLGKAMTNSWSDDLKKAREKALGILQNVILDNEAITSWSRDGLFSQHRKNYRALGAFGKTHTQKEIEKLRR